MFGWLTGGNKSKREIIVNAENLETRVAVMESGRLEEFEIEHPTEARIVGSVFKGKIQNLEHDLQAAFVDIGMKKNAFLHYWDMIPDDELRLEMEENGNRNKGGRGRRYTNADIERRFPQGSDIVVQVTKGPIGTKGPRVTANLSIPGRYLVMMPGSKLKGVSRKIDDEGERMRLKKVLSKLQVPSDIGLIVRTAALGAHKGSIADDFIALIKSWREIQYAVTTKTAPCCIYQEPDLVERVVRDWLTEDIDRIVIDERDEFERIREIAGRISRKAKSKINLYEGELPVFDHYDVERQLLEAFRRKVTLKSGGYIVFDETEALIAIDVNTGRHKGKGSQEDAIHEVNTEAVEEVARQLRLRNVGGLVVIDLIDMKSRRHQNSVYRAMKASLKRDKARTNVLPISELGIMEMTRQRVEESLLSSMYVDCPYCKGRGTVKSALSMSVELQRQVSAIMRKNRRDGATRELQVVVHPSVMERLRTEDEDALLDIEQKFEGRLSFKSDPTKHLEFFAINNAATGEVLFSSADK
ncbi:MAG: ribonuclease E/G [Verrucomicrobia bacterium]|nr:ribonuclease E/G [Verrucomicrobiota bacterium]